MLMQYSKLWIYDSLYLQYNYIFLDFFFLLNKIPFIVLEFMVPFNIKDFVSFDNIKSKSCSWGPIDLSLSVLGNYRLVSDPINHAQGPAYWSELSSIMKTFTWASLFTSAADSSTKSFYVAG